MGKFSCLLAVVTLLAGCGTTSVVTSGNEVSSLPADATSSVASSTTVSAQSQAQSSLAVTTKDRIQTYTDARYRYAISFPAGFSIAPREFYQGDVSGMQIDFPHSSLQPGTTLYEAFMRIEVQPKECGYYAQFDESQSSARSVRIGGVVFRRIDGTEFGAGNRYEVSVYTASHGGYCYRLTTIMHSCNIGPYCGEGHTAAFDKVPIQNVFDRIVGSFTFLPS